MYNLLLCGVGKRGSIVNVLKNSLQNDGKVIAVDTDNTEPALYIADKGYIVPRFDNYQYIDIIVDICEKESIKAIIAFNEKEISTLSVNKERFKEKGVILLLPSFDTIQQCIDKYSMYNILNDNMINTIHTYLTKDEITIALEKKKLAYPLFAKSRYSTGYIGSKIILSHSELDHILRLSDDLIFQEYMQNCVEVDADLYVDPLSKKVVAIFTKLIVESKNGGVSKAISFHDDRLFHTIQNINELFDFSGPINMDFFCLKGIYYLAEINLRFGSKYVHAYGAGVDFVPLMKNNIDNIVNNADIGNYEKNIVMMKYNEVVIKKQNDLIWTKYS